MKRFTAARDPDPFGPDLHIEEGTWVSLPGRIVGVPEDVPHKSREGGDLFRLSAPRRELPVAPDREQLAPSHGRLRGLGCVRAADRPFRPDHPRPRHRGVAGVPWRCRSRPGAPQSARVSFAARRALRGREELGQSLRREQLLVQGLGRGRQYIGDGSDADLSFFTASLDSARPTAPS